MVNQSRSKSALFWIGLISAVYTAFVSAGVTAGVAMPWYIGAVGVALSAVLTYCNGNNPSIAQVLKTSPAGLCRRSPSCTLAGGLLKFYAKDM